MIITPIGLPGYRLIDANKVDEIIDALNGGASGARLGTLLPSTSGAYDLGSATYQWRNSWVSGLSTLGGTATSGVLMGSGASGANKELGTTADNALEFYLNSTHTTGDMRGMYLRLYFSGAGGSGEAARIFATVNNVTAATGGTVNGAHVSLSITGASGAISGAGNALRATLGVGAGTTPGGTISALQIDSDFDATATIGTGVAAIRVTNSNTGLWANLMQIPSPSNGSIFAAHTTQTMTQSIRIRGANGTAYYVMCTDTATNRS